MFKQTFSSFSPLDSFRPRGLYSKILPLPEQSCKIYCDKSYCGPVSGGGADPGVKGVEVVMGEGVIGPRGDTDGGPGGGIGTVGEGGRGGGGRYG